MIDFFYCCNVTEVEIKNFFFRIYVGFVWLYTHDYAQFGHQESVNVNVRKMEGAGNTTSIIFKPKTRAKSIINHTLQR